MSLNVGPGSTDQSPSFLRTVLLGAALSLAPACERECVLGTQPDLPKMTSDACSYKQRGFYNDLVASKPIPDVLHTLRELVLQDRGVVFRLTGYERGVICENVSTYLNELELVEPQSVATPILNPHEFPSRFVTAIELSGRITSLEEMQSDFEVLAHFGSADEGPFCSEFGSISDSFEGKINQTRDLVNKLDIPVLQEADERDQSNFDLRFKAGHFDACESSRSVVRRFVPVPTVGIASEAFRINPNEKVHLNLAFAEGSGGVLDFVSLEPFMVSSGVNDSGLESTREPHAQFDEVYIYSLRASEKSLIPMEADLNASSEAISYLKGRNVVDQPSRSLTSLSLDSGSGVIVRGDCGQTGQIIILQSSRSADE